MRFRTELPLEASQFKISHTKPIFMIGSCFSSSIGKKLTEYKFSPVVNPYGTLYHPYAITSNLIKSMDLDLPGKDQMVSLGSRMAHYQMHSAVSAPNTQDLIELIKSRRRATRSSLLQGGILFITLGSAYYFYHRGLKTIVANCHKQPNSLFDRRLASVDEIGANLIEAIDHIHKESPTTKVIFTVSPVRHIRDGLIANNRSKSHLIAAIHDVVDQTENVTYFPAYELLLDDLRDYRFYDKDLIHPSDQAIDYIWDHFQSTFMTVDTIQLIDRVKKIKNLFGHKPFEPKSNSYRAMLKGALHEMRELIDHHHLDFSEEIKWASHQLD